MLFQVLFKKLKMFLFVFLELGYDVVIFFKICQNCNLSVSLSINTIREWLEEESVKHIVADPKVDKLDDACCIQIH